jgi:hypothetical protein
MCGKYREDTASHKKGIPSAPWIFLSAQRCSVYRIFSGNAKPDIGITHREIGDAFEMW